MAQLAPEAFAAFVGLDWADATHDVCLHVTGTARREFLSFAHRPEAIDAWVQTLRTRFSGRPVAVCLELKKGPIVSALRKYDCLVLFPVHPLTVARYREAFTPSRAKTTPPLRNSRSHSFLHTVTSASPCSPTAPPCVPSHNASHIAVASSATQSV